MTQKVDMISISFGLHERNFDMIDPWIREADHKKILIFASACNDGNREAVSYPANDRSVFSVRAVDGNNKLTGFSPDPTKREYNFAILGTNLESTWPTRLTSPLSTADQGPKIRSISGFACATNYMTGTSFAAPLMAALIANVYAYYRENYNKVWEGAGMAHRPKLECFVGVQKVLKAMTIQVNECRVIAPWRKGFASYGDESGDDNIYYPLKQALRAKD